MVRRSVAALPSARRASAPERSARVVARAIFTYGTLALPVVLQAVTGRLFSSEEASLPGFERFGVRGEVFPGLLETGRGETEGRVYFGLDDATLGVLDRFEDCLYERRTLDVVRVDGAVLAADAWVVADRHAHLLDGSPWDLAAFRRRDLAAYLRGCRAFREEDRAKNRS